MEEKVVLTSISVPELLDLISATVKKEIAALSGNVQEQSDLIDRKEAAALLGITLPTLREYTRRQLLKGYRLGTRIRYRRSEVLAALKPLEFSGRRRLRSTET